jgi:hypothetical protein
MHALEVKNSLPAMVLAQPAGFHRRSSWLVFPVGVADKDLFQLCQPFRKISENFRGDFSAVAARVENSRYQNPTWRLLFQWGT